ncbi:MAG TPA: flavodoxin domain-containing protein [Myxococcales bacterium]|nr:flavodoxin domain-containing protein [Myxococcales bacterium]
MPGIAVIYASSYGHTAVIADRIAGELAARGLRAEVHDVRALPKDMFISRFDAVILGGRVHGQKFPRSLRRFVRDHRSTLNRIPSAFYTVSLSMAGKDEAAKQDILRITARFPAELGWKPSSSAAFAGALPYTKYGWLTRTIMKRISAAAGGDTDTSRDYVYTDWDEVRRFADEMADKATAHVEKLYQPPAH